MVTRSSSALARALTTCAFLLTATGTAVAQEAALPATIEPEPSFLDSLASGDVKIKLNYRLENVDEDGISKRAKAATLRTVLNYSTLPFHGFQFVIEFEDVRAVGADDYNDTINGKPRPVIADPEGTEVNQGYVDYQHSDAASARLGRQQITLDNHRFIGNVAWRQNFQTYDAVSLKHQLGESGELFAAYLDNVNRIFGENSPVGDHRMGSTIVNANWQFGVGKLTGYWYNLDYDDAVTLSTSTLGLRFIGERELGSSFDLLYALEGATQTDIGDNPNSVDADYYLAELGAGFSAVSVKFGLESLSGSSTPGEAFSTPLATLHAFNGWADKFLTTPAAGLEDAYVAVQANLAGTTCKAVYHQFQAETGSADYGDEIDLMVTRPINKNVAWGLKYASYMEDGLYTDTEKIWAWVTLNI